ncbi:MAG: class I SAM-dependent methyltransferase, partial [Pseudomonadota bacterium]
MSPTGDRSAQSEEWARFYAGRSGGAYLKWPTESMVKLVYGRYLKNPLSLTPERRVLDVGCGFRNNLVPFIESGCECHGVDIDPRIAEASTALLASRGYKASLRAGSNRGLPPDGHFDLLLSVNTLHYKGSEENVLAALREFRRVVADRGAVYLSTVGPVHDIRSRAHPLGGMSYEVRNWDFRDGQRFYFFEDKQDLASTCRKVFADVETGRVTESL